MIFVGAIFIIFNSTMENSVDECHIGVWTFGVGWAQLKSIKTMWTRISLKFWPIFIICIKYTILFKEPEVLGSRYTAHMLIGTCYLPVSHLFFLIFLVCCFMDVFVKGFFFFLFLILDLFVCKILVYFNTEYSIEEEDNTTWIEHTQSTSRLQTLATLRWKNLILVRENIPCECVLIGV